MTEDAFLVYKKPLAVKMAREATASNPWNADDAEQEALIAVWQTSIHRPESTDAYLNGVMRTRVQGVVRGDRLTGQPAHQGRASIAATATLDTTLDYLELLAAADLLHDIDMAYHRGEIAQAIDLLSPREREYVLLRFWQGLTPGEIMIKTGMERATMDSYWKRAKIKLRAALPHLVDAY